MARPPRTLVLSDGDIPGLTACALVREEIASGGRADEDWPLVMAFPGLDSPSRGLEAVVMRQAELLSFRIAPGPAPRTGAATTAGEVEASDLLAAVYLAARAGCARIIWPVHAGTGGGLDPDRLAAILERAALVARLVMLDSLVHGVADLSIETPFADFTTQQLADLAADMAVPVGTAWWSQAPGDAEAEASRAKWTGAFEAVGWPVSNG